MEEIKVGESVRTNDGDIGKLIRIERDDIDTSLKWYVFNDGKNERYVNKPYIINHSKNITDLIECGDIIEINKEKYEVIYDESFDKLGILIPNREELAVRHSSVRYIFSKTGRNEFNNISILTHEQFEQNCYKLDLK